MATAQAITKAVGQWLRAYGVRTLCFVLAAALGTAMLLWFFRQPLGPVFGVRIDAAVPLNIGTWHWIAAWMLLWFLLSVGAQQTAGTLRGALLSGCLPMTMGLGTWLAGQMGAVDMTSMPVIAAALTAFWAGWITVQFAHLRLIIPVEAAEAASRRVRQNYVVHRNDLTVHFGYVFASLLGLGIVASQFVWPDAGLDERIARGDRFNPSLVFAVLITTTFLPLLTGFWIKAKREAKLSKREFWRKDVVSPVSFGIITSTVIGVTVLAFFAATYASDTISTAISYATFVGIFLLFFLVIVVPHVVNYLRRRREEQITIIPLGIISLDVPAQWLSYLDTLLVKVVAPLSGGAQSRFSHLHVIGILALLSLLGLIIPRPFGLVPVALGILFAIALGRRWAWVEADRETASRLVRTKGSNIHLGFENDLKDEALTGYAGLFILVPLTLYQIQELTEFVPPLREQKNILLTWIVFFGGEMAKAVPFVDWWDIYGNAELSSNGKHLTFLSRAAVDLVILSALFQALSIWQRDQVQARLFKDGHLDAFDPFKEREFFERGIVRLHGELPDTGMASRELDQAEKFKKRLDILRKQKRLAVLEQNGERHYFEVRPDFVKVIKEHVDERERLLREASNIYESAAPYSRERLGDLISKTQPEDLRAGARWMIARWEVLVGTPSEQLEQITQRWEIRNFPDSPPEGADKQTAYIRTQKMAFERILIELASKPWINRINKSDVSNLMQCLRRVRNDVEFDFSRILAFEIFGALRTEFAVFFLSKFVLQPADLEAWESWSLRMIVQAEGPDTTFRAGRSDMRERVYSAAGRIACNSRAGDGARKAAHELLVWMSQNDGAQSGRDHASLLAARAAECLENAGLDDEDPKAEDAVEDDSE